jgi:two-component system cell cycle response regulator
MKMPTALVQESGSNNKNLDDRVLIIDDDDAIRESMQEFIERSGFTTFSAGSAEEAMELLVKEEIHVAITDIILPGRDGLELTDYIKSGFDIDVIVMTGYSGDYSYEEAVNKGASDFVFKPVRFEELLLRLKRVLKERRLTQERAKMLGKLQNLAITDGLTKLYNSRHFYSQLGLEVGRSSRYKHPLALLLLDIDHFKDFNDTYGHLEGDKILVSIGRNIQECLRAMDSAYRYGGEEFTVILPETNGEEAHTVAERIRQKIGVEPHTPKAAANIAVTISVGVTQYIYGEEASVFVQRADQAMYVSKKKGRNIVTIQY